MNTRTPRATPPKPAPWTVASTVAEIAALTVTALAAGAGLVSMVAGGGGSWAGVLAPLLVLAGTAVAYVRIWAGFALVAAGSVAAALPAGVPVAAWSMVCFAAFLFALKWLPALLVIGVLAPLNFLSAAYATGTVDVNADPSASVFAFAVLVAASAGAAMKGNIRYRAEAERRLSEAERARAAAVERGVARERLRIARDLHDSVGHHVAVVSMHLGAAEVSLEGDSGAARRALREARTSLQAVLRETQQILALLRADPADASDGATPGYDSIPGLVAGFRSAGLTVRAEFADAGAELPAPVGIAAYRIVQEALTNAHRYGDGEVTLEVSRNAAPDGILVIASNRGGTRVRPVPGGGNGLVGMRERAESVGGTLDVRRHDGEFRVRALLPAERSAP